VAVKQLKAGIDRKAQEEFLLEVWLTTILDHTNIVNVLAVCTKEAPFLVALEYMSGGNLLDYLHGTQARFVIAFNFPRCGFVSLFAETSLLLLLFLLPAAHLTFSRLSTHANGCIDPEKAGCHACRA